CTSGVNVMNAATSFEVKLVLAIDRHPGPEKGWAPAPPENTTAPRPLTLPSVLNDKAMGPSVKLGLYVNGGGTSKWNVTAAALVPSSAARQAMTRTNPYGTKDGRLAMLGGMWPPRDRSRYGPFREPRERSRLYAPRPRCRHGSLVDDVADTGLIA